MSNTTERGVLSTNRPPAISQTILVQNKNLIIGSEDTATLSLYVRWQESMFRAVTEYFDEMKTAAQNTDHQKDHFVIGNRIYLFSATGHKSGTGQGPMYRWKMECEGLRIAVANQHEPKNDIPNVIVNVGSLFLMKNGGLLTSWPDIKNIIETFNCVIDTIKISRLDGCVDLADIDVSEYVTRFENNCYISRAKKGGIFNQGKRKTGFKLGSGKQIRIYDKLLEVEHQPEKMMILIHTRWGGRLPQCATRVEYQIGSEDLRKLGIVTLEDYKNKRCSLFEYLTHNWFRMTDTEPTKNHHDRTETSNVWKIVQTAFSRWTGKQIEALKFRVDQIPDYSQLSKQAIGCISSIAALKDIEFDDTETLAHYLGGLFQVLLKSEDLKQILEKTEAKRKRFNALGRVFK